MSLEVDDVEECVTRGSRLTTDQKASCFKHVLLDGGLERCAPIVRIAGSV
jgi:hypothetical protein